MLKTPDNKREVFEGERYARTEEELFDKAIALLDKCKITVRPSEQEEPESTLRSS